jgi:hypothetical protein
MTRPQTNQHAVGISFVNATALRDLWVIYTITGPFRRAHMCECTDRGTIANCRIAVVHPPNSPNHLNRDSARAILMGRAGRTTHLSITFVTKEGSVFRSPESALHFLRNTSIATHFFVSVGEPTDPQYRTEEHTGNACDFWPSLISHPCFAS